MRPSSARCFINPAVKPRRLSKPTFLQRPSLLTGPENLAQSVPEQLPSFPRKDYDIVFFQQVRKIIAARQSLDEIWPRSPHPVPNLGNNEAISTQEYCHRRQRAWNDWKMNLADLIQMEETKDRQTNPGVRDTTHHTHLKRTLGVIRKRVENDAASDNPQLTPEENQEINLEIGKFKDVDKCFPNCGRWNNKHGRHGRLNCQKCSRFS